MLRQECVNVNLQQSMRVQMCNDPQRHLNIAVSVQCQAQLLKV